VTPELRLVAHPGDTYAALVASPVRIGPLAMFRRPAFVAFVLGCSVAMAGTRHLTPLLAVSAAACWSVLVVGQVAIALGLFAQSASRTVGIPRALDLFFASHVPWSLWMLAVAAWAPVPGVRAFTPVLVAALPPMVLTPRIIAAFCREVLGMDRREAIARTTMHQVLTWGLLVAVYGWAVALWPRIVQWLQ
jgi:hypothetical protein